MCDFNQLRYLKLKRCNVSFVAEYTSLLLYCQQNTKKEIKKAAREEVKGYKKREGETE